MLKRERRKFALFSAIKEGEDQYVQNRTNFFTTGISGTNLGR
jgi:hypothetical protein